MACGFAGMQFVGGDDPAGPGAGDDGLGQQRVMDARRAAAVHLDGGNFFSNALIGRNVSRACAVAQPSFLGGHARERAGLRDIRLGFGFVGRDHRDEEIDAPTR